jgi:hypothetical protein
MKKVFLITILSCLSISFANSQEEWFERMVRNAKPAWQFMYDESQTGDAFEGFDKYRTTSTYLVDNNWNSVVSLFFNRFRSWNDKGKRLNMYLRGSAIERFIDDYKILRDEFREKKKKFEDYQEEVENRGFIEKARIYIRGENVEPPEDPCEGSFLIGFCDYNITVSAVFDNGGKVYRTSFDEEFGSSGISLFLNEILTDNPDFLSNLTTRNSVSFKFEYPDFDPVIVKFSLKGSTRAINYVLELK